MVISYKKNSRIVLARCRRSSPKWFRSLCPQRELELFPTSPGEGRSNPGYCQITASTLGRLCVSPLHVRSLISISPLELPGVSLWPSKPNSPEGLVLPVLDLWAVEPKVGFRPLNPLGESLKL